jgi:acetyl-CoA carboxylase carboxyl transferase subunit beta
MEEAKLFQERRKKLARLTEQITGKAAPEIAGDAFECPNCGKTMRHSDSAKHLGVCQRCGCHTPLAADERLEILFGKGAYSLLFEEVTTVNPISFPGYEDKIASLKEKTGINEACLAAVGEIDGAEAVCAALDSRFLMGSMGTAVGEKVTLSVEYAESKGLPLIIFSASGGARMQEGIFSLMQMAKTASAVKHFSESGGLYISYLTHPTTGGVIASFASLGDIILAEPGAHIGFAGPRVIEQTIKAKLPEGFQRSEFLLEHGFVDAIVPRAEMKRTLSNLLRLHAKRGQGATRS